MKEQQVVSVATILERELGPTIKEWLRRVNLVPELTDVPLSDADRTGHLPKLYADLICRLRLAKDSHPPVSASAAALIGLPPSVPGSQVSTVPDSPRLARAGNDARQRDRAAGCKLHCCNSFR